MSGPAPSLVQVASDEHGFTLIELMVAVFLMALGIMAVISSFDSARRTVTKAEMLDAASAMGDKAIERVSALPWKQIALTQAPTNGGGGANDPSSYISAGPCATGVNLPAHAPCYQWDWQNSANVEPLVVDSANGDSTTNPLPWSAPVSASDPSMRVSGSIYRYITWVNDPQCTSSSCGGQKAQKRITVAVTVQGLSTPIWRSTLVTNPVGTTANPLNGGGATCLSGGVSVPCVN